MSACPKCGKPLNNATAQFCPYCGNSIFSVKNPAGTTPLQPAQVMHGRYTILRPLSTGGMGALYLAGETIAGQTRKVVVKEMLDYYDPGDTQGRAKAQSRFEAEAATLAGLNIPGVPQIFDYFSESGRNFIVMQFIEGQNLQSGLTHLDDKLNQVRGRPYSLDQVRRWGVQICHILDSLSSQKIYHLDIKPANLILDKSGTVWLVDFGTAKAPRAVQPGTPSGGKTALKMTSVFGTLGYAPPEQSRGKPEARSDVYALAATLYHLATDDDPGEHPGQFPQLGRLPGEFEKALRRALEPEVIRRISARELGRLLEPRATRPLGFYWQDGTITMEPGSLTTTANQNWEEAHRYFTGGEWEKWLEDQHRHDLANQLKQIKQQISDPDLALDSYLRSLDPTLPAARLSVPTANLDIGTLPWRQKKQVNLEIQNSGGGCLQAHLTNLSKGLRAIPEVIAVHEKQTIEVILDSWALSPSNSPQVLQTLVDAGAAGQVFVNIQATIPEPALLISPIKLSLGSIYRGQQAAGKITVSNTGGSELRGEVSCSTAGWSIEPTRFQCLPGKSRLLQVSVDSQRMPLRTSDAPITIEGRAGAWRQTQTVQARLAVSPWKTFIKYAAPPLAWIFASATMAGMAGWLLTAGLFHDWSPSARLGFWIGFLLGAVICVPPCTLAGGIGWLGPWRDREGLKAGAIIGVFIGIIIGSVVGSLAGWASASLGLTGALVGVLCGASIGVTLWKQKKSARLDWRGR